MHEELSHVTLAESRYPPTSEESATVLELANVLNRLVAEGYGDLNVYLSAEGVVGGLGDVTRVGIDGDPRGAIWIGEAPNVGENYVNGPRQ